MYSFGSLAKEISDLFGEYATKELHGHFLAELACMVGVEREDNFQKGVSSERGFWWDVSE